MPARKKVSDRDLRTYKAAPDQSESERGAEYMDWLARTCPGRAVPVPYIMKVTYDKASVPKDGTEQIDVFKGGMLRSVRRVLFEKYRRAFKHVYATGYRASVDDNDIVENFVPYGRVGNAVAAVDKVLSITTRSRLNKANKSRYDVYSKETKAMQPAISRIMLSAGEKEDGD